MRQIFLLWKTSNFEICLFHQAEICNYFNYKAAFWNAIWYYTSRYPHVCYYKKNNMEKCFLKKTFPVAMHRALFFNILAQSIIITWCHCRDVLHKLHVFSNAKLDITVNATAGVNVRRWGRWKEPVSRDVKSNGDI